MSERKFILRNSFVLTNVLAFIGKLSNFNEPHEVIVRPFVEKRSLPQNNRLWLLHTAAAKHIGCTKEDMHEEMLCHVFGVMKEVRLPSGNIKRIPNRRSSDLNKREFREFADAVEAFYIAELGVWLDQEAA